MAASVRALGREVDVIVAFQPYCGALCVLARPRAPWMVVTGADPRRFRDTSRVPGWALRMGLERARLRTAPTEGLIDCHRRLGIAARSDWRCIPNAVDEAAFVDPSESRAGALFVGRLVPEKRPLLAVNVAEQAGVDLSLLGEGPARAELERAATQASRARVTLLGYAERPWETYARHRVLLVTSRYEAFGNMIVESLAAATPVVSVDCDFGPREVLRGATHSMVTGEDGLAAALARVASQAPSAVEATECRAIAERYRVSSLAPVIDDALVATAG